MFTVSVEPMNKALAQVEKARKETHYHNTKRKRLMLEMAEENVGRFGVEKRNEIIEQMKRDLDKTIAACNEAIEYNRSEFIALVDSVCNADGSMLDNDDIALLNANAVSEMDLFRMLNKHSNNFTMQKAIKAYCVRNDIKHINGIDNYAILFAGEKEELSLRLFAKLFFDKCISAANTTDGYVMFFVRDRNAIAGMLTELGLMDTINIDKIIFPSEVNYSDDE